MGPKGPNILIRRLNEVKATFEEVGMLVTRGLDAKTKLKTVEIRKTLLPSLLSYTEQNHAQITSDFGNDIGNDTLHDSTVSLPNEEVNRAQNKNGNDSNGIHDTLHDSTEADKIKLPCDYCHQPFTNRTELIAHMDKESAAAVAEYERKRTEEL